MRKPRRPEKNVQEKKLHSRRTVGEERGRKRQTEGECIALPEGLKTLNERSDPLRVEKSKDPHIPAKICAAGKQKCSLPIERHKKERRKKKNKTIRNETKRTYINIAGKWMVWGHGGS